MMNRRRLMAFYAYCRQPEDKTPELVERAHHIFRSCENPHLNLSREGVKILRDLIEKHPSNDYSEAEKDEINRMIQ